MAAMTLEYLLDLEHRGWDALSSSRAGTFYGELMTETAVMVLVNGLVLDRATIIETLDQAPPWDEHRLGDAGARLVRTGADAVALVYTATASRTGDPVPFTALMTSHYRMLDGRVRMTLYQQTTITH